MEQAELLRYVLDVLDREGIAYMLVGSLASGVFGEARLTHDIDVVIELPTTQVDALCEAFPDPEFYVSLQAAHAAAARRGQFNVIHPSSGNKVDFVVARDDAWGREQMLRRHEEQILPGRHGYVASPEDVILGKLWYYHEGKHEKHLRDIAAMLQVSGTEIDRDYIETWSNRLGLHSVWQAVLERLKSA